MDTPRIARLESALLMPLATSAVLFALFFALHKEWTLTATFAIAWFLYGRIGARLHPEKGFLELARGTLPRGPFLAKGGELSHAEAYLLARSLLTAAAVCAACVAIMARRFQRGWVVTGGVGLVVFAVITVLGLAVSLGPELTPKSPKRDARTMSKPGLTLIVALLLLPELGLLAAQARDADGETSLARVTTLHVDRLGTAEGAELLREKLINLIFNSKKLQLTEDRGAADAVLTGVGRIDKRERFALIGGLAAGGTYEDATLLVRLVARDKTTLWAYDGVKGCSKSAPECAVRELLKAIDKARKDSAKKSGTASR